MSRGPPPIFCPCVSCLQAIWLPEIAHMQVDQCGNQEAHAEVLCRRHRVARAIAARANLP